MRAFLALDLPEALRREVTWLQAGLEAGRPVEEDNLHLTLCFLGDISEPQARDVAEALAGLDAPPVELALRGVDLPGGRAPTLLWIGAEPSAALVALQAKCARLVRAAGVPLERRRFRPHVTLARFSRVPSPRESRAIGDFLALNGAARLTPARADTVTLYESHLRETGPLYLPLAEARLERPAPADEGKTP